MNFIVQINFITHPKNKHTMKDFKYAAINEAIIYAAVENNKGSKPQNRILMGTYVSIIETSGDWYKVITAGTPKPGGWMHKDSLTDSMGLKVFFLDVGQGDGVLLEVGNLKILIDAGPDNNMHNYLTKWQYKYILQANKKVHIDYLIVSHFDTDHYKGFIKLLEHQGFTFGTICHAGILKFAEKNNPYKTELGDLITQGKTNYVTTLFDNLITAKSSIPYNRYITSFMNAIQKAKQESRVAKAKRYEAGDIIVKKTIEGQEFKLEVLAPFTEKIGTKKGLVYWKDEGVTINGNSLVIKATFGKRTMLLGGDLNTESQNYLMTKYSNQHPFEVDVAKSCHHGSSDFSEDFLKLTNPLATVISSGDNEGYAHPRADAIGCAGKYSRSKRPLVYSTELARSTNVNKGSIQFGMINLRCNGNEIYMSQMKEVKKNADIWDSYEVK